MIDLLSLKKIATSLLLLFTLNLISCSNSDDPSPKDDKANKNDTVVSTQKIVVNATDYKHQFIGGGVSIGLFLGHHYSMSAEAQDKAIRLLAEDCNMKYYQDYIEIYPSDNPEYFDKRANYIKASKVYQPDLEFSLVGNKFPKDLMKDITVDGEELKALNTDDPEIYNKLANWWFELFKGFKERGVSTEILNVVNEPDLDRVFRKHHYGLNGDTKEAVAQIFKHAVPKFKEMLNDPSINTLGMKVPLIMGPSTISTIGCLDYLEYFKTNHADVWELIDIVATHQYEHGGRKDVFEKIVTESEGKPLYQSETHALKGDAINLSGFFISRSLKATLSLFNLFATAVNNGTSSWFYFENNYPNVEVHPGGLLSIPWAAAEPTPYKHYYAFKQLTSAQPALSNVITTTVDNPTDTEIIAFRKQEENTLYVHFANYDVKEKAIEISLSDNKKISSYTVTTTDNSNDGKEIKSESFSETKASLELTLNGFSVNTLKINFN